VIGFGILLCLGRLAREELWLPDHLKLSDIVAVNQLTHHVSDLFPDALAGGLNNRRHINIDNAVLR
jgi:hypothetical protein